MSVFRLNLSIFEVRYKAAFCLKPFRTGRENRSPIFPLFPFYYSLFHDKSLQGEKSVCSPFTCPWFLTSKQLNANEKSEKKSSMIIAGKEFGLVGKSEMF